MIRTALIALSLAVLPGPVFAEPGSGTDLYRVNRQVEEMMRDGRWQRLLQEAEANRQAVERSRQVAPPPTAFTTSRRTRRR
jgi:hypothetical protein